MRNIVFIFVAFICNLVYAENYQELMKQGERYFVGMKFKKVGKGHKFDEAIDIFTKICESNNAKKSYKIKACENLMVIYSGNANVDTGGSGRNRYRLATELKDIDKRVKYATMACDLDSAVGCSNLGYYHKNGDGVEIDLDKTTQFYTKACELSKKESYGGIMCNTLGVHYEFDIKDLESALKVYKMACKKDKAGCVNYDRLRKELE